MLELEMCVSNQLGLHARAAAHLVRLASRFDCCIMLRRNDTSVSANAKSILSVLHLAAGCGVRLTVTADGIDEQDAVEQIFRLFEDKFGEGS